MLREKGSYTLKTDEEFKRFVPPLSDDERTQLEKNLLQDGCRDALIVWNNIIIDGHNRYDICTKHQIPFALNCVNFLSREEATAWICANQLGRRNISEETRRYLIGKRYEMEKTVIEHKNASKQNQYTGKVVFYQFDKRPKFTVPPINTGRRLGKEYRINQSTVIRYGLYANALDTIFKVAPELHEKIMTGQVKVPRERVVNLANLSRPEIKRISSEWLSTPSFGFIDLRKKVPNDIQLAQMQIGAIKDMPKFDPDAEILSLSLTVPSWANSINRVRASAKLSDVTDGARKKITEELGNLKTTIDALLYALGGNS